MVRPPTGAVAEMIRMEEELELVEADEDDLADKDDGAGVMVDGDAMVWWHRTLWWRRQRKKTEGLTSNEQSGKTQTVKC